MQMIILCGIKHCGKSTQGRLLAERFRCNFYDTDDIVTRMAGRSPRQIYNESGAEAFMRLEAQACKKIAEETPDDFAVVATGGGICNNAAALEILRKAGTLVFMQVSEDTAADRIAAEISSQPDGSLKNVPAYIARKNPKDEADVRRIFHDFYEERTQKYAALCDITIKMPPASREENSRMIIARLEAEKAGFLRQDG